VWIAANYEKRRRTIQMLIHENYFSPEMMMKYMSTSQFKAFESCEAAALAELKGEYAVDKEAYKEGRYFEHCITGNEELFMMQNPDMISSKGATKGDLKSNYKRVSGSVEAFNRQYMFTDVTDKCESQVIVTGDIGGIPFKGMVDFLDMDTFDGYDTKCMKDFKKVYSDNEKMYVNWFFAYGYNYQAAIYRELIRQTFGEAGRQHILAVTKEEVPDVAALHFSDEILDNALDIIKEFAPRYDRIKRGLIEPERCEKCAYCRETKVITDFEMVGEFE
jgi:hypothetical protein